MVIDFNNRPGPVGAAGSGGANRSSGSTSSERTGNTANGSPTDADSLTSAPSSSGENVQLSPEAQQLQQVSEKLRDMPSVDNDRIAQLRQAIADGSYKVNSQQLASRIIAFESDW